MATLDPEDWDAFRIEAHKMLDAALNRLEGAGEGRVWTPLPEPLKADLKAPLPTSGQGIEAVRKMATGLLPYGVGNTHPRFFGWVHGAGSAGGLVADIAASAMNANLGGRDHGAMYVEKQVVDWVRQIFDFPAEASGLVVSGTSMATIIALKTARDLALDFNSRKAGVDGHKLVGYTSTQAHGCVARAFDMLGLGANALRLVPVNDAYEMDTQALSQMIAKDKAAGLQPFCVVGTAGSVNVGSIDDLATIADIAQAQGLWFHIDGAFGATAILSPEVAPRLSAIHRADSLAFDFHKWLHVNYDAGFVMLRSESHHRRAFSARPEYLAPSARGLAAGNPWPTEYGPELSRGFRALKIWAQLVEHGTDKLGEMITKNCAQARHLEALVKAHPAFELMAPVALNICCFRYITEDATLNEHLVTELQLSGIAAPSTTILNGQTVIRVNITNHRTRFSDLDLLLDAAVDIAKTH